MCIAAGLRGCAELVNEGAAAYGEGNATAAAPLRVAAF